MLKYRIIMASDKHPYTVYADGVHIEEGVFTFYRNDKKGVVIPIEKVEIMWVTTIGEYDEYDDTLIYSGNGGGKIA